MNKKNKFLIYVFYRFVKVNDKKKLKLKIDNYCQDKTIRGTILISDEGINATISGANYDLLQVTKIIKTDLCIRKLNIKINVCNFLPFNRIKVRIKKEIVTIGIKNLDVNKSKAKYLNPSEWNKHLNDHNVKIIDTRNDYEIAIGKFKNSINMHTNSFREFPSKFKSIEIDKKEKASAFLNSSGYENVYQLEGGIINYLNFVKENKLNSMWSGECFVFDNRVTINKNLLKGKYIQCYGCRRPLTNKDIKSKEYRKGVHCPYCINERSERQIRSSVTRQSQIDVYEKKRIDHTFKKIKSLD